MVMDLPSIKEELHPGLRGSPSTDRKAEPTVGNQSHLVNLINKFTAAPGSSKRTASPDGVLWGTDLSDLKLSMYIKNLQGKKALTKNYRYLSLLLLLYLLGSWLRWSAQQNFNVRSLIWELHLVTSLCQVIYQAFSLFSLVVNSYIPNYRNPFLKISSIKMTIPGTVC